MSTNIAQLLSRSARIHPYRPALALGPRVVLDYCGLARRVASLAWTLRHHVGLTMGDRVALLMANCPQYVEVLFACWHAGLVAVPVNAKLHPKEVEYILQNCGARLCFVTPEYDTGARSASAPTLLDVIDARAGAYERLFGDDVMTIASALSDEVAWLFYTSGTTGRPKGVMITHRNLLALVLNYFTNVDTISPCDSIVHAAPMSHGSGLYIAPHVAQAAVNVSPESGGFDPAEIHALISAHHGVTVFAAPTMVKRMVDCREDTATQNLKTIVYGGAPMYLEQCKRAIARYGYKLAQIYGQGEAPMTITALNKGFHSDVTHPRYQQRLASVGHPFAGVEVRVADPEDRPLPAGETGEILVHGDVVMRGYWQDSVASAETLRGGWLHTGDVGILDEEGFLTLKDRIKDVVISGGSNIYPREVEEVLLRHPLVLEAAVVGMADSEWGESVVAFVVVAPGNQLAESELDALCLQNIARFKRPKRYEFVQGLPKNMTGKVLKTELRKRLADKS